MLHYCCVASVPVRAEPHHQAEQISQSLWGEALHVLEVSNEWARVQCSWDHYLGWVPHKALLACEAVEESALTVSTDFALVQDLLEGSIHPLSMGSRLRSALMPQGFRLVSGSALPQDAYSQNQVLDLETLTRPWLGTPYLWGGRSRFGIDCSGFTQIIMSRMGHAIPRDAQDQWAKAPHRRDKPTISSFEAGQLAFFGPSLDRINHVGLVLGPKSIIHSSGKVRIDHLDEQGISMEIESNKVPQKVLTHTIQGLATY